jgi:hypothetical protein
MRAWQAVGAWFVPPIVIPLVIVIGVAIMAILKLMA